jgi:hypothetical protein
MGAEVAGSADVPSALGTQTVETKAPPFINAAPIPGRGRYSCCSQPMGAAVQEADKVSALPGAKPYSAALSLSQCQKLPAMERKRAIS